LSAGATVSFSSALRAFFHEARYVVFIVGLAAALQAPPVVLVAEATFANVV
jgi:hypothetical protein